MRKTRKLVGRMHYRPSSRLSVSGLWIRLYEGLVVFETIQFAVLPFRKRRSSGFTRLLENNKYSGDSNALTGTGPADMQSNDQAGARHFDCDIERYDKIER